MAGPFVEGDIVRHTECKWTAMVVRCDGQTLILEEDGCAADYSNLDDFELVTTAGAE